MASRVQGLERLKAKLAKMPAKMRAAARKAVATGCDEIVAAQKSLVPRDSGDLADSIGWTFGDAPPDAVLTTGGRTRGAARESVISRDEDIRATVFAGDAEAFYARQVEFGTAPHEQGGRFAGTQHPGTAPQPFFFPAYRAKRRRVRSRITRDIRKAAREVAGNG